ncbi:MAG: HAMP domain-containing sensor histidine kinase, partial [Leptospirales bacterium]
LLTLSQTESGSIVLDPTSFDLAELLKELTEASRVVAEKKNIALFGDYARPAPIYADRDRLAQVFNNLIGNAIKYSPAETEVRITLAASGPGDRAVVTIVDQGLGIPPEDLQNIFRPFHRTANRPTGGEKSTGLGLSIVRRLIEAHEGSIGVESTVGGGSRFTVELPPGAGPASP